MRFLGTCELVYGTSMGTGSVANQVSRSEYVENTARTLYPNANPEVHHVMPPGVVNTTT